MNVIEELKRRLDALPNARYNSDAYSITVLPTSSDGFEVGLMKNSENSYTVFFNGWHEDFADAGETINIFGLGLSNDCRLREYRRGNFAYKWTVEILEKGQWHEQSTTALILFPFWRKRQIRYLQNRLLGAGSDNNR